MEQRAQTASGEPGVMEDAAAAGDAAPADASAPADVASAPGATPGARAGTAGRLGSGAFAAVSAAAGWVARPRVRLSLTGV
ncbi:MAG: hypothetical protein ACRDNJ_10655, partial [Solirubrobacteraceae bacterium]